MGLETALPAEGFLTTRLNHVINWARRSSLWPLPFATACCGIELMSTAASRYDLARFGAEVLRFSPRQSDLLIVAGRVAVKMMPVVQRIYLQMCEPKWLISMGACASTGGVFDTYAVVQGIDQFIHVDVYVVRARLPAAARDAAGGHHCHPAHHRRGQHPLRRRGEAAAAGHHAGAELPAPPPACGDHRRRHLARSD
jgi:NADH-quinone oxidoreductase B subunit